MTGEYASDHARRTGTTPSRAIERGSVRFAEPIADGSIEWTVEEVDARAVPGARGPRCLIFTRQDNCIRRVWDYPANWRTLDDAGLAALSWRR